MSVPGKCSPAQCHLCCGHGCLFFRNDSGCLLSDVPQTGLWLPRVPSTSRCRPGLDGELVCMSCTQDPDSWRGERSANAGVKVSGNCHHDGASGGAAVRWSSPVNLSRSLTGSATIVGDCPLVFAQAGASILDAAFECESGDAAVHVKGRGVTVRASVVGAALVRAVSLTGVDVAGLVVERQPGGTDEAHPVAVLGNTKGDYSVDCGGGGSVVSQPLSGKGTYSASCDVVDLQQLLGVFGTHYEIEYYNKDAFAVGDNGWLAPLAGTAALGLLLLIAAHQDVIALVRARRAKPS